MKRKYIEKCYQIGVISFFLGSTCVNAESVDSILDELPDDPSLLESSIEKRIKTEVQEEQLEETNSDRADESHEIQLSINNTKLSIPSEVVVTTDQTIQSATPLTIQPEPNVVAFVSKEPKKGNTCNGGSCIGSQETSSNNGVSQSTQCKGRYLVLDSVGNCRDIRRACEYDGRFSTIGSPHPRSVNFVCTQDKSTALAIWSKQ